MTERYVLYLNAYEKTSHYILMLFGMSALLAAAVFVLDWIPEKLRRPVRTFLDVFCLVGFIAVMVTAYVIPPK